MYNKAKMVCVDDDNNENIVGQVKSSWGVRSFLVVCEAIIRSALIREESKRSSLPL
jgi:hypothetical protein